MNLGVHFSSAKGEWETPWDFFAPLHREFDFVADVCATADDTKCTFFISPEEDGLLQDWTKFCRCWMNPPYGRSIGKWVQKAWEQAGKGALVVCLLPSRTDTKWWGIFWDHNTHRPRHSDRWEGGIRLHRGDEVRFVKGRLKFGDGKNPAPFPSAVVVMRPRNGV